jgi:hypothetical protein
MPQRTLESPFITSPDAVKESVCALFGGAMAICVVPTPAGGADVVCVVPTSGVVLGSALPGCEPIPKSVLVPTSKTGTAAAKLSVCPENDAGSYVSVDISSPNVGGSGVAVALGKPSHAANDTINTAPARPIIFTGNSPPVSRSLPRPHCNSGVRQQAKISILSRLAVFVGHYGPVRERPGTWGSGRSTRRGRPGHDAKAARAGKKEAIKIARATTGFGMPNMRVPTCAMVVGNKKTLTL